MVTKQFSIGRKVLINGKEKIISLPISIKWDFSYKETKNLEYNLIQKEILKLIEELSKSINTKDETKELVSDVNLYVKRKVNK